MADSFESMMANAADMDWRENVMESPLMGGPGGLDADVYLAAFSTPAGRAVLRDLHDRFVNVTRWYPGEDATAGFYREGGAQVVFFLAAMCETAAQGESTDADEG